MSEGFLGRWSRRKLDARDGKPLVEEPQTQDVQEPPAPSPASLHAKAYAAQQPPDVPQPPLATDAPAEPPPPTLEEAAALTPESDFRRFAAPNVSAEVKNAAMKKLFSDPRYNVMDGLDVYTGDYSQPDPLPESMLRDLVSAKFLGFFAEKEAAQEGAASAGSTRPRDDADDPAAQSVAQSDMNSRAEVAAEPSAAGADDETHADADLRLQPDDAAPGENPGHGTG
jgi:hypothetical protein